MKQIFIIKKFDELTLTELYDLLKLRIDIFCVEQNCVYNDCDGHDQNSYHVLCIVDNILIGCTRIMPPGEKHVEPCISRVVLKKEYRGSGIADELMKQSIIKTQELFTGSKIKIDAQTYLENFYSRFGFKKISEPFLWDGIPHIQMIL